MKTEVVFLTSSWCSLVCNRVVGFYVIPGLRAEMTYSPSVYIAVFKYRLCTGLLSSFQAKL